MTYSFAAQVRLGACAALAAAALAASPSFGGDRLTDAVRAGDAAAAKARLRQGAPGHAEDADGTTALHWAVQADDADLARTLLRAGARADAANRYGVTPLARRHRSWKRPSSAMRPSCAPC